MLRTTSENPYPKSIGIIAGSGDLPKFIISSLISQGYEVYVIAIKDFANREAVAGVPHIWVNIAQVGAAVGALREHNANKIIMAGKVNRVHFTNLRPDIQGIKLLFKLSALKLRGDDALFRSIIKYFEKSGFEVIGIDSILPDLLTEEGIATKTKPGKQSREDIETGINAAKQIGRLDIGQAVIVQNGHVLAVEAAEGTDNMMKRTKDLQDPDKTGGVLIKVKKPGQETKVDLPAIGIKTVEQAHQTGLSGIALEAGGSIMINRTEVIARANELNIFIAGIDTGTVS